MPVATTTIKAYAKLQARLNKKPNTESRDRMAKTTREVRKGLVKFSKQRGQKRTARDIRLGNEVAREEATRVEREELKSIERFIKTEKEYRKDLRKYSLYR